MECVIFDLDGTICDCEHRRHHVTGNDKNWTAFNNTMGDDAPSQNIIRLAVELSAKNKIVMCTGREDVFLRVTELWLTLHGVPFDAIYMRPKADYRDDPVIKRDLLAHILADGYKPWLVVDDRSRVVAMWREMGLTCLQCADGNF